MPSVYFHGPGDCPFGHRLGASRVWVGWSPCGCASALAGQRGHTTWRCRACEAHGWTTTAYSPAHLRGAADVERELASMYDEVVRARRALAAHPGPGEARDRAAARLARLDQGIADKELMAAARRRRAAP